MKTIIEHSVEFLCDCGCIFSSDEYIIGTRDGNPLISHEENTRGQQIGFHKRKCYIDYCPKCRNECTVIF